MEVSPSTAPRRCREMTRGSLNHATVTVFSILRASCVPMVLKKYAQEMLRIKTSCTSVAIPRENDGVSDDKAE
jgi:hypothetical protein